MSYYKNTKLVKVKVVRCCKQCGSDILEGSEALTTNKRYHGRAWYCLPCVDAFEQLEVARTNLEAVAFGDEGAASYYLVQISEAKEQLGL